MLSSLLGVDRLVAVVIDKQAVHLLLIVGVQVMDGAGGSHRLSLPVSCPTAPASRAAGPQTRAFRRYLDIIHSLVGHKSSRETVVVAEQHRGMIIRSKAGACSGRGIGGVC